MTSVIAREMNQPMSEILSWTWDEIVDRLGDAIEMRRQAAILAGARLKG